MTLLATSLASGATATAAAAPVPSTRSPDPTVSLDPAAPVEPATLIDHEASAQARVGALINEGQALFDTADYVGAIGRWTEAYAHLPDDPHLAAARNLISYQIAQAHIEAFAMDLQPSHLRKAERLLRQYIAGLDPSEIESFTDAEQRLVAVERQIVAATPPPVVLRPAPPTPTPAPDPRVARRQRLRGPLLLLGGISLGLGGALLIGTTVAAITELGFNSEEHNRAVQRGAGQTELEALRVRETRVHQATIATAVVGSVMLATGIALVVTSRVHKRSLTAQPALTPGFIGARLGLQF